MILSAVDIVRRHGDLLDEAIVRRELEGNICRCTGITTSSRRCWMRPAA